MIVPMTTLDIMIWGLAGFILALLCLGVNGSQSVDNLQWLPCEFVDEKVHLNESHIETPYIYRKAVIQFGNDGDMPLYPNITFLVTAMMVIVTRTPSVEVGLLKEPTLHCQFAVDHKKANVRVEWIFQRHGEHRKLSSYSSNTAISKGTGVSVKDISAGNASFKLPPTQTTSEGTYICSVLVPPLNGSHNIPVNIRDRKAACKRF